MKIGKKKIKKAGREVIADRSLAPKLLPGLEYETTVDERGEKNKPDYDYNSERYLIDLQNTVCQLKNLDKNGCYLYSVS